MAGAGFFTTHAVETSPATHEGAENTNAEAAPAAAPHHSHNNPGDTEDTGIVQPLRFNPETHPLATPDDAAPAKRSASHHVPQWQALPYQAGASTSGADTNFEASRAASRVLYRRLVLLVAYVLGIARKRVATARFLRLLEAALTAHPGRHLLLNPLDAMEALSRADHAAGAVLDGPLGAFLALFLGNVRLVGPSNILPRMVEGTPQREAAWLADDFVARALYARHLYHVDAGGPAEEPAPLSPLEVVAASYDCSPLAAALNAHFPLQFAETLAVPSTARTRPSVRAARTEHRLDAAEQARLLGQLTGALVAIEPDLDGGARVAARLQHHGLDAAAAPPQAEVGRERPYGLYAAYADAAIVTPGHWFIALWVGEQAELARRGWLEAPRHDNIPHCPHERDVRPEYAVFGEFLRANEALGPEQWPHFGLRYATSARGDQAQSDARAAARNESQAAPSVASLPTLATAASAPSLASLPAGLRDDDDDDKAEDDDDEDDDDEDDDDEDDEQEVGHRGPPHFTELLEDVRDLGPAFQDPALCYPTRGCACRSCMTKLALFWFADEVRRQDTEEAWPYYGPAATREWAAFYAREAAHSCGGADLPLAREDAEGLDLYALEIARRVFATAPPEAAPGSAGRWLRTGPWLRAELAQLETEQFGAAQDQHPALRTKHYLLHRLRTESCLAASPAPGQEIQHDENGNEGEDEHDLEDEDEHNHEAEHNHEDEHDHEDALVAPPSQPRPRRAGGKAAGRKRMKGKLAAPPKSKCKPAERPKPAPPAAGSAGASQTARTGPSEADITLFMAALRTMTTAEHHNARLKRARRHEAVRRGPGGCAALVPLLDEGTRGEALAAARARLQAVAARKRKAAKAEARRVRKERAARAERERREREEDQAREKRALAESAAEERRQREAAEEANRQRREEEEQLLRQRQVARDAERHGASRPKTKQKGKGKRRR